MKNTSTLVGMSNRHKAITSTNDDLVCWRIHATPGLKVFQTNLISKRDLEVVYQRMLHINCSLDHSIYIHVLMCLLNARFKKRVWQTVGTWGTDLHTMLNLLGPWTVSPSTHPSTHTPHIHHHPHVKYIIKHSITFAEGRHTSVFRLMAWCLGITPFPKSLLTYRQFGP